MTDPATSHALFWSGSALGQSRPDGFLDLICLVNFPLLCAEAWPGSLHAAQQGRLGFEKPGQVLDLAFFFAAAAALCDDRCRLAGGAAGNLRLVRFRVLCLGRLDDSGSRSAFGLAALLLLRRRRRIRIAGGRGRRALFFGSGAFLLHILLLLLLLLPGICSMDLSLGRRRLFCLRLSRRGRSSLPVTAGLVRRLRPLPWRRP